MSSVPGTMTGETANGLSTGLNGGVPLGERGTQSGLALFGELEERVVGLLERYQGAQKRIAELEAKLSEQEARLTQQGQKLEEAERWRTALRGRIGNLIEQISEIEATEQDAEDDDS